MGSAFSERIPPLFRFPRNFGGRDRRINSVRGLYVKQQINININLLQTDLQEEFPADSFNDLPALIESRIESIANLDA